ncbi:hypothetical protein M2271_002126 [Streptomyces sp. LBL]|nr:hypothetical protein [Streptomyces sp. LBL]
MWTDSRDLFLIKTVCGNRNLLHPANTPVMRRKHFQPIQ